MEIELKNLALCIKMEVAYRRWIAADPVVARLASESDADMRRLLVMIAPHL
jgi:hypothetical protein